ncbi:MAG TPA: GNAT family N-acetyltransferase [Acidisarcina sp.]
MESGIPCLPGRLLLRPWQTSDLAPYAELNRDPQVRKFFPTLLTREESDAEVGRFQERYRREGFCLFAAQLHASQTFIGFIGIQTMHFAVPNLQQPAVEIGWRLASAHWNQGLATEGAQAVLDYAFSTLKLSQIVAITSAVNAPSRRVMEKLGMSHVAELNFDHPHIPEGHWLQPHVLYSIAAPDTF